MIPRRKNTNGDVTRRSSKLYTAYEVNLHFTPTISGFSCYPTTGIVGSRPFKNRYREVVFMLESKGLYASSNEIRRAVGCFNKFPDPDLTGVLQHSRAAFECVARKVTGYSNPKQKIYWILKQRPDILPDPLRKEALKLWTDASKKGAHIREGEDPTYTEAEWVVDTSIQLCMYMARKMDNGDGS